MDESDNAQWERAHGAFALVVDTLPRGDASWTRLRKALRLSRADAQWLRDRIPGAVRRGAREDLETLAERVREAGYDARVVRQQVD